jgi:hypothetical protein
MTDEELIAELRSGKSIADVAKEKGVDTKVIKDEYLAQVKTKLDEQVADGKLTQKMADAMLEQTAANLPTQLTDTTWNCGGCGVGEGSLLLKVAAEKLGLTQAELMSELRNGKSIADVAKEKGVDTQVISDEYLAQLKAKLDAQVADGSLTQDEADATLAQKTKDLPARLTDSTWDDMGGPGHGGRGYRPDKAPHTSSEGGL